MYKPSEKMSSIIKKAMQMREENGKAGTWVNWSLPDGAGVPVPEIYEALLEAYAKD